MFGRRKHNDSGQAIAAFWQWWAQARHRVAAAISDGTVGALADEISHQVKAIHKDLQWELSRGKDAQHALVVTPGGAAALRATVARWRAAAPAADEVFEYFGARQPDDDVFTSRIEIAGQGLDLDAIRFAFGLDEDKHEIDVAVFHPAFPDLPDGARLQVTFLALDWALGEEQVELWVGGVEGLLAPPSDARTFSELRTAVGDLAAQHAEPLYAMLGAETRKGLPVMAMVQVPLKSARWPRFDTHIGIAARYAAQPDGLPTDESLAQLRELEDQVEAVLPPDGEVVGHETSNGMRTIHVYVDGATRLPDAVTTLAGSFKPLRASVSVTHDPGFEQVAHLRT